MFDPTLEARPISAVSNVFAEPAMALALDSEIAFV